MAAVQELEDLRKKSMEELTGNLMAYEMELNVREEHYISESERKSITLNSILDNDEENNSINELAMLMNGLKKWSNRNFKSPIKIKGLKSKQVKYSDNFDDEVICFKCKKPGHIRTNCPPLQLEKGKKKKGRAFAATWDDEEG